MEPYQPISQPSKSSSAMLEIERPRPEAIDGSSNKSFDGEVIAQPAIPTAGAPDGSIGVLEVFVHEARDIQNICIYHKQDVYTKLCLTSDPEVTVSSHIINGGGRYPIFNESLRLNVRTVDASLKCEVWMLSRVRNYLEDQLLGFALVPLSDVVAENGTLAQEFSLSSTDLFHSPAGFIRLSLSYAGSSPEVMAIAAPPASATGGTTLPDLENGEPIACEYDKIEFPDFKIANENRMMVSEYFGILCPDSDSQCAESLIAPEKNGNCADNDAGVRVVESFSTGFGNDSGEVLKDAAPLSSVSTNGSSDPIPATSQISSEPFGATASSSQKHISAEVAEGEADSSRGLSADATVPPVININIEPDQTVVQQEIVDMYMKSMQQFTESLAKMNLPMDIEKGSTDAENANLVSEQKLQTPKGTGSRVFYGSRAFF